ncbi:hypothetical protein [Streptomyces sp. NPDC096339]|uniref:helix-turn-helix transcriptional regulator n=1 Tax=Streptomyces sp. NPDC096339 TaxID=3366086 RepID=UPI0037F1FC75
MIDTDPYDPGPARPPRSGPDELPGAHPARQDPAVYPLRTGSAPVGAADPATELGRLIRHREALLRRESAVLTSLRAYVDRYPDEPRPGPPDAGAQTPTDAGAQTPPEIETLAGTEAVAARVDTLLGAAKYEVLILDRIPSGQEKPGLREFGAAGCRHIRSLLTRGVTVQTITDRSAMDFPGKAQALALLTGLGLQARIGRRLPTSLLLVDRQTCLLSVPRSAGAIEPALVFGDSLLRQAVLPLFESLWGRATPVGNADSPLTQAQRELLGMLASGLKDESIARRLGVHVHTARRRITRLLGDLDADTRFQAGVQAATRGWLHPAPEA